LTQQGSKTLKLVTNWQVSAGESEYCFVSI
jgi:hypothetical protein